MSDEETIEKERIKLKVDPPTNDDSALPAAVSDKPAAGGSEGNAAAGESCDHLHLETPPPAQRKLGPLRLISGTLLVLISVLKLCMSIPGVYVEWAVQDHPERTEAVLVEKQNLKGNYDLLLKMEYKDRQNKAHTTYKFADDQAQFDSLAIGSKMGLKYVPEMPEVSRFNDEPSYMNEMLASIVFDLAMMFGGLWCVGLVGSPLSRAGQNVSAEGGSGYRQWKEKQRAASGPRRITPNRLAVICLGAVLLGVGLREVSDQWQNYRDQTALKQHGVVVQATLVKKEFREDPELQERRPWLVYQITKTDGQTKELEDWATRWEYKHVQVGSKQMLRMLPDDPKVHRLVGAYERNYGAVLITAFITAIAGLACIIGALLRIKKR